MIAARLGVKAEQTELTAARPGLSPVVQRSVEVAVVLPQLDASAADWPSPNVAEPPNQTNATSPSARTSATPPALPAKSAQYMLATPEIHTSSPPAKRRTAPNATRSSRRNTDTRRRTHTVNTATQLRLLT
ncbi:hypothetical protein GCM10022222_47850 [Amycolatopsis ultiminotia]|uniref:Uncharacterized protein n=1 Tax=Amycolatopsis ultiminotia TaxID=543629 RepID=A0ABP6WYM4_9PSEU